MNELSDNPFDAIESTVVCLVVRLSVEIGLICFGEWSVNVIC